jgi:hypothetical protein
MGQLIEKNIITNTVIINSGSVCKHVNINLTVCNTILTSGKVGAFFPKEFGLDFKILK